VAVASNVTLAAVRHQVAAAATTGTGPGHRVQPPVRARPHRRQDRRPGGDEAHLGDTMGGVPRLPAIRYAGFLGAVLLAAAARLGGALPDLQLKVTPVSIARGGHGPLILTLWLVGTALLTGAWWAGRAGVPSGRWAGVTVALWMLPLLLAPPLGSRDVYAYACQGATYAAGFNPYAQGVSALPCPWLDSIAPVWRDTPAPYGPLFVLLSGGVVGATGSLTLSVVLFRVIAVAGVALTALYLPVLARRCGVPATRAVWLASACPLVGIHVVSGAHNDALMIGLLVAGLTTVAARPGRAEVLMAGGALLGLAVAVKVTALVVLPFAVLAGAARPFRRRTAFRDGAAVLAGAVAGVAVVTSAAGLGSGWIAGLSRSGDSVQWTSPPTAVGQTLGYLGRLVGVHVDAVPAARVAGLVGLAAVLAGLWWATARLLPRPGDPRPAVVRAAGLALAATVALAPVFHPWYATWPLVVLAASTTRTRWLAGVCAVAGFLVLPDGTALALHMTFPGAPVMTVLVVLVAVRGIRWVRQRRRPAGGVRPWHDDRSATRP
jgi:alpha-1,6-mannosyltransferase